MACVPTRRLVISHLLVIGALALLLAINPGNLLISNLVVACIGLLGGVMIGRHIVSPKVLAVALMCGAAADCISFLFGPTHFAMKQAAGTGSTPVMAYLSISVPIRSHLYSVIGLGDLWIYTACVAATRRLGWSPLPALCVPLSGILAAVATALLFGPLPALPFLAVPVLGYLALSRLQGAARRVSI